MVGFYDIYIKVLIGYLVTTGTFILSRNLFDSKIKFLINFTHQQSKLPLPIRLAIFFFGYRKRIDGSDFWGIEYYPSDGDFSDPKKKKRIVIGILEPFIGFLFILVGTIISITV